MITGYEEPVLFPSMNLYDTGMMQMYVNAAREQYNQNREDMANFLKEYGSFTSPISSDVTWVDQQTRGRVNDAINYLQQNGIDPLRSAEGRAVIQRVINSTDVAGINARRQSAENRKLWDKTAAALKAEGKYNANFVNWAFRQKYKVDPSQWSTASNGIWQETSPEIYQDLNAATKTWYDQMQPGYLGTVDGYDYVGNTPEDVAAIAKQNLPDLTSTYWQYQKELARRQLGPGATEDQINGQLINNIVAAQAEKYMRPTRVESKEHARAQEYGYDVALDNVRTANDLEAYKQKQDIEYAQKALEAADANLNGRLEPEEVENYRAAFNEALENGGYAYSGVTGSRGTTGGGSQQSIPAAGPADQLDIQQSLNYQQNKQEAIGQYEKLENDAWEKQKAIYETLTDQQKKNAVRYGKAYRTLHDSKASKSAKDDARLTIEGLDRSQDSNFVKWRNQFNHRMELAQNKNRQWLDKSTTQGMAGYQKSTEDVLHTNSNAIFERNNIVPDLTDDQKIALNKQLGYSVNDDNGRDGIMTSNRDFADITIAKMTGNRGYKHNSAANIISRAIKNREFTIEAKDLSKRKYGAGSIGKKRYNVIVEIATFTDPDVVAELDQLHEDQLKRFGIKSGTKEDGTKYYKIPIISKFGHGQGRASVNNAGTKASQGQSEAGKQLATQQAREITANLYGQ